MRINPIIKNKPLTKWQSDINKTHKNWCRDNGYPTEWAEIKVGRPKKNLEIPYKLNLRKI